MIQKGILNFYGEFGRRKTYFESPTTELLLQCFFSLESFCNSFKLKKLPPLLITQFKNCQFNLFHTNPTIYFKPFLLKVSIKCEHKINGLALAGMVSFLTLEKQKISST